MSPELSPAPPLRRGIAKAIDLALSGLLALLVQGQSFIVFSASLLLWDLIPGGSPGKRLMALLLLSSEGAPAGLFSGLLRNLPLALCAPLALVSWQLWLAGTVAFFLIESALAFFHPDGLRLGDRLSKTRVMEGELEPPDNQDRDSFTKPDL